MTATPRLQDMSDDRLDTYLQAVLDEARRALIEVERRRAQRKVSHLSPAERRARMGPVKP